MHITLQDAVILAKGEDDYADLEQAWSTMADHGVDENLRTFDEWKDFARRTNAFALAAMPGIRETLENLRAQGRVASHTNSNGDEVFYLAPTEDDVG